MSLFLLLALAGIPLTSGFTGKFAVFAAAMADGMAPLVVVAMVASAVTAFFYLRIDRAHVLLRAGGRRPDGQRCRARSPTAAITLRSCR